MPIYEQQEKELIAAQLGKTGDTAFAHVLDLLYEQHRHEHPTLRFLLVKYDCYTSLLLGLDRPFDWKEGDTSESRGQLATQLQKGQDSVADEIQRVRLMLRGNAAVSLGQITRKAPIEVTDRETPTLVPDPNSRRYRGDVRYR